ncbi:Glyoxalase OS=Rhodanobacter lindaniclasticus OX=75310 GN=B1991_09640 PE=4 SV=1 [Rhodanobacter lindaniclasticus]
MALDFVAPWGLRIRLLGGKVPDAAEDGVHTMAAAPRGN